MKMEKERYGRVFQSVETHTVGEPTRIITAGFPDPDVQTIMDKKKYFEENCDQYRNALMCEPRGHKDMVGAVIVRPVHPEANVGVVYMDAFRWINMCGHASIGCATFAVEAGLVPAVEPYTDVVLDTPAGIVPARVKVSGGHAEEVTISNVPSFLLKDDIAAQVDGRTIHAAVAFGGAFFALVDARQLGLELSAEDVPYLVEYTKKLLKAINEVLDARHPTLDITRVVNAEYYLPQGEHRQRNIVISEEGTVDRSPCGTGTSAKLAYLYAKGEIRPGEVFENQNFTGALFKGVVKEETGIGAYKAIYPMITGSAYISGEAFYYIDENDPVKYGFTI